MVAVRVRAPTEPSLSFLVLKLKATHFCSLCALSANHDSDSFVSNTAHLKKHVRERCRSGDLGVDEAWSHFNSLLSLRPLPSVWSFNRLLGALSNGRHFSAAVAMYKQLAGHADTCTVNVAIKCLCRIGAVGQAFAALGTALKRGLPPDAHTLSTLLHGLAAAGRAAEAADLLRRAVEMGCARNEIAFAAVIAGLCRAGETAQALSVLRGMRSPSADCFSPVIDRLWREGRIEESLGLFREMIGRGIRPDVVVFTSVVHGLCAAGRRTEAMELMLAGGEISPNVRTFTAVIDSLCKEGKTQEALSLFESMIGKGVKPDVVVFNSLLSGLCKSGRWTEATALLEGMKEYDVRADVVTVNVLLDARCKEGSGAAALSLLETIAGDEPVVYESLISRLCRLGKSEEAERLIDDMATRKMFENVRTLNIVLNALADRGMIQRARKLFDEMLQEGRELHTITCNILIKGYCARGEMDEAKALFDSMPGLGFPPSTVSYNTLVNGYVKVDRTDVALRLMKEMIRSGLAPDRVTRFILKGIHAHRLEHQCNSDQSYECNHRGVT